MKLWALSAISAFALIPNVHAGSPAVSGGPAQPDTGGAVYAPTTLQTTSGLSPGANANNTAASSSSAGGGVNSSVPASNSSTSGGMANANQGRGGYNGFSTSASANPPSTMELKKERVAEISQASLAAETAKTQEKKSELSKKFDSSLLDQAVDITAPQAARTNGPEKAKPDSEGNKSTGAGSLNAQTNGHRLSNSSSQDDH